MIVPDVRNYIGKDCSVTWRDNSGVEQSRVIHIHDITLVPLYGAYLVGDVEDVCLDKVTEISLVD